MCYLSQTYSGRRHDKRICDEEKYRFPPLSELLKDTGFQGYEPENVITYQPKKKPRGGELTSAERVWNRIIASARIVVENVICGIKRCRILKDTFRNTKASFDDTVMNVACGLHNLRVRHRQSTKTIDLLDLAVST